MTQSSKILTLVVLGALAAARATGAPPVDHAGTEVTERPDARWLDSDGVSIRYVDRGSGEPVLLLHSFGARLEFWERIGLVPALSEAGFRLIAYDARGHGESGKPHAAERYGEEEVADAIRLLDHLSIDRAHVVGYSRGSEIASHLVARHPKRIRSVVFGGWGAGNPVASLSVADCLAVVDALASGMYPRPLALALQPEGAPLPSAEERTMVMRQLAAGNDLDALAAAFRSGCGADGVTARALRATGVPALAVLGAADGMVPSVRRMADEMDDALAVEVIPDADHFSAPGHPEFIARVLGFLAELRGSSPGS